MAFRNKLQNDVPEANVTGNKGRSSEYENLSKSDNYLNNIVLVNVFVKVVVDL